MANNEEDKFTPRLSGDAIMVGKIGLLNLTNDRGGAGFAVSDMSYSRHFEAS
jgi:hypothetical protein